MREGYEDIINLKYPYHTGHEKMSMAERAAQFSPFAALTGYDDLIREEARYVDDKIKLSQEEKDKINQALNIISKDISTCFDITYFIPDKLKENGGRYIKAERTRAKKISDSEKNLTLCDDTKIKFKNIVSISI